MTLIEGRADERRKVLIAGGGVAGVEALLALTALAAERVSIELMAPDPAFTYRPLSVAEPFALAAVRRLPLAGLASEHGARYRRDALAAVDSQRRVVLTTSGAELDYDFLLLALGARASDALPGALTFRGQADIEAFAELLGELERGDVGRLVFAVPVGVRWPLPVYELALMTAAYLAARSASGPEITVVTHEAEPLEVFGPAPSARVRALAVDAGVRLVTSSAPSAVEPGRLALMSGAVLLADRVVALPKFDVPPLPGIPQGPRGFIQTDLRFRVEGLDGVYAAGDAIWYPIKQGGLAAQQADVAAEAIAAAVGAAVRPAPFHPMLRGILVGGKKPLHLRSEPGGADSRVAAEPLWWPPGKVAGRYLAPYLAALPGDIPRPPLNDIEAGQPGEAEGDQARALDLTLAAADSSARWEDYEAALRWLSAAERLNVVLPIEYARRRRDWSRALAEQRQEG